MAEVEKKEAATAKKSHTPRNFKLPGGVWRYSRSKMYHRRALFKVKKTGQEKVKPKRKPRSIVKPIGGENNGGKRLVQLKKERRYYPTEDKPKMKKTRKMVPFKKHTRHLRKRITPGTVLILLAGRHRGKRVVFLKQLETGLLLVTGPYRVNGCPLRRINQIYVIATSTKLDISKVNIPENLNDKYFRRKKPQKKSKKPEAELFETKKEEYAISKQRKDDQIEVDRQILGAVRSHSDKKTMFQYLRSMFYLQNKMYPHKMRF